MPKESAKKGEPTPAERMAAAKVHRPKPPTADRQRKVCWVCRIAEVRERLGLTTEDVASATGISSTSIWAIEKGVNPRLTNARRIATFFGMTVEEMWPEEVSPADAAEQE